MRRPLVSILIPAYKAEATLVETLDSALAQTWPNTEIIVVDDGSTDDTLGVARSYEARGVRVFAENENHGGPPAALNRALAEMSSDTAFVQYLDADDTISANKIETQMQKLIGEPAGTLATCAWARFYDDNPQSANFSICNDYRDYSNPVDWLIDDWTGQGTMANGAWLCPRGVIDKVGPWREGLTLNNDMEYFTRVMIIATGIKFVDGARMYYRSGNPSLSKKKDIKSMISQRDVISLSTKYLLAHEDSPRARRASACYWQSLAFMAYPDYPELVAEAEAHETALGGGTLSVPVNRPARLVSHLLGWKVATRVHRALTQLRYS